MWNLARYQGIAVLGPLAVGLLLIQSSSLNSSAAPTLAYPCTVAWNASHDTNVTGYAVYYGLVGSLITNRLNVSLAQSVTFSDLKASADYFFYVVSYDATGIESPHSNVLYHTPPALSPLKLNLFKNGAANVQFWAATNAQCHVEFSPTLSPPQWQILGSSIADSNGNVTITDVQAGLSPSRFYRAVEP